jgi:phosphatidylglycerol:prolipoprotein diacylglycerol transferase
LRQTLFYIPTEIAGWPLFGVGILLFAVIAASTVMLAVVIYRHGFGREVAGYLPILAIVAAAIVFVLPAISQPEGLPIRGFGVTLLAGIASGVALTAWRAKRRGLNPDLIYSLAFWMFATGFIGARLFYVVEYWPQFSRPSWGETIKAIVAIQEGGLVIYGCVLCGAIGLIAFVRTHKIPGFALADLMAPGLMIGIAFGRIGCFLNGCCFGGVCELPWAMRFPAGSPPYIRQAERGELYGIEIAVDPNAPRNKSPVVVGSMVAGARTTGQAIQPGDRIDSVNEQPIHSIDDARQALVEAATAGEEVDLETSRGQVILEPPRDVTRASLPVHPTQLYSVLDAALICLFLLAYEPLRRRDGEATAWTCTLYPITRFLIETIRTDEPGVFGTGMTIAQNISLCILVYAAGLWIWLLRSPPKIAWPIVEAQPATSGRAGAVMPPVRQRRSRERSPGR